MPVSYDIYGFLPKDLKCPYKQFVLEPQKQLIKINSLHVPYLGKDQKMVEVKDIIQSTLHSLIVISVKTLQMQVLMDFVMCEF